MPLYRSRYTYHRYPLTDYLASKGYWSARPATSPRWVSAFHWNDQWWDGTALFHKQFGWRGEEWIKWSDAHPDIAADLWPRVLRIIRDEEPHWHLHVAGLLMNARGCSDIRQYRKMLELYEEPLEVPNESHE